MSGRPELVDNDPDLLRLKLEMFEQRYITSKNRLLYRIDQQREVLSQSLQRLTQGDEMIPYLKTKITYLDRFEALIQETPLPDHPGAWWTYSFSMSSQGVKLYLNHHAQGDIEGDEDDRHLVLREHDAEFPIMIVKAKLLTADEFAKQQNVASATIRVWIRRGKIRSAIKYGNSWMIPELTSPMTRKYTDASYEWSTFIEDAPHMFPWFSEPGQVSIMQDHNDKQTYVVIHFINSDEPSICEYRMPGKDAEKLEAFLISCPLVTYVGDTEFFD